MRKAKVIINGNEAGVLSETVKGTEYIFEYNEEYNGPEVSPTMLPTQNK
jgi:hypothetical protein